MDQSEPRTFTCSFGQHTITIDSSVAGDYMHVKIVCEESDMAFDIHKHEAEFTLKKWDVGMFISFLRFSLDNCKDK